MANHFPIFAAIALIGATACSPTSESGSDVNAATAEPSPATKIPSPTAANYADWAGKWVGPEGMYVEISPTAEGAYTLTMQSDLDTQGTYTGQASEDGIAFERGGEQLLLKAATGDETGLKYLAGKSDCLMVTAGEGYCRD